MYPRPVKIDIGKPKWLGGVTKVARMGFDIYNKVKKLIPGGTEAGAGPVPGSDEELEEFTELFDMPDGFDEVVNKGKSILDKMEKEDDDAEAAW